MSLLRETEVGGAFTEADIYANPPPTGLSTYLKESFASGFDQSLAGRALETIGEGDSIGADFTVGDEYGVVQGTPAPPQKVTPLDEDRWRRSRFYREGIEYQPGMTEELAASRAQAFDERRWRDQLFQRYEGGLGGQALGFIAGMAGGAVSPENYVPILGPAAKAAMVARLGRVGGAAVTSAAEGAIGAAVASPLVYADLARRGEDVGVADVALDVVMGATVGSLFGTVGGALDARRAGRVQAVLDKSRVEDIQRRMDAVNLAAAQIAADEPVSVGKLLSAEGKFRQRMLGGAAFARAMEPEPPSVRVAEALDGEITGEGPRAADDGERRVRLRDLDLEDLERYLADDAEVTTRTFDEIMGTPERAARYRRLKSAYDNALGREQADAALARLSAEFGDEMDALDADAMRNDAPFRLQDLELLKDAHDQVGEFAALDPAEIGGAVGYKLRQVSAERVRAADQPDAPDDPEVDAAAIVLDGAMRELRDRGLTREQVNEAILQGTVARGAKPADAEEILADFLRRGEPTAAAAGEPPARRANAGFARLPGIEEAIPATGVESPPTPDVRGDIGRFVTDYLTTERVDPPAEPPPPVQRAADPLAAMRTELELDEPPELAEVAILQRDGLLTEDEIADLAEADEVIAKAERWATAYETLAICAARHLP